MTRARGWEITWAHAGRRSDQSQEPETPSRSLTWVIWTQALEPLPDASLDAHWQETGLETKPGLHPTGVGVTSSNWPLQHSLSQADCARVF